MQASVFVVCIQAPWISYGSPVSICFIISSACNVAKPNFSRGYFFTPMRFSVCSSVSKSAPKPPP